MRYLIFIFSIFFVFAQDEETRLDWKVQVRERTNMAQNNTKTKWFNELRTRFGVKFSTEKNLSGFIQVQDSRQFGNTKNTLAPFARSGKNVIDFHQAYFTIGNLFDSDLSVKMGRMEVAYTNQRIVGSVGWHNVGRNFDGLRLRYDIPKGFIDLFSYKVKEEGAVDDKGEGNFYGLHYKNKFTKKITGEVFYYANQVIGLENNLQTAGFYVKGAANKDIYFEAQFAKQFGTAGLSSVSYDGLYYNAMLGYKFDKKASLAVSYEALSGDDKKDAAKVKTFSPMYGTNHKFNGYMDKFYVGGHKFGINGLNDITITAKYKTLKVDFHMFSNNQEMSDKDEKLTTIGNEIDITYKYKYSKHLAIVPGFSVFMLDKKYQENSDLYAFTMFIFSL